MNFRELLNQKQYEAVSTSAQFARVIAGAGSGKTRVLTYRIAYLINEMGVDPSRILAFTFTNKAAKEMGERASKLVEEINNGYCPKLNISTFHSFCARFLRAEHKYLIYEKEVEDNYLDENTGEMVIGTHLENVCYPIGFTIYSEDDTGRLVKSIAPDLGYKKGDDVVKKANRYIRNKKMHGIYPENINPKNVIYEDEKIYYKFFVEYEKRKTANVALDFDDLICKTLEILKNFPEVATEWQSRYDHILIDEFQDTDNTQMELIEHLLKNDSALFVVGDPDQTIYTWRGANQGIIVNFDSSFKNTETIILNENYRSTEVILSAANKLISYNKKRVPKDLYTTSPGGEAIVTKKMPSLEEEAKWVANQIRKLGDGNKDAEGNPIYSNIAVLYRSSYLTRAFESELKDRAIAYRIFGGLRFYERMEVKDLLAYFSLMVNPKDDVSFERIVNVPKRGIGELTVDHIKSEASLANLSEYEYILSINDKTETNIPAKAVLSLQKVVNKMEEAKERMHSTGEDFASVLKDFVTEIDYFNYISNEEDVEEDRVGNVNALFDDITNFSNNNPDASFEEYLQNVTLLTSQDDMNGGNYVSLMTIHNAKGLEFDNVFVIGMNEGVFPSFRAESESGRDGSEEERRLAYVAFTRAKKRLFLSCNSDYSYVTDSHSIPSKFFKEAGVEIPHDEYNLGRGYSNGYSSYGSRSRGSYSNKGSSKSSFVPSFNDGKAVSPFEESDKKKEIKKASLTFNNGINDWAIGDKAKHELFGEGTVVDKIGQNILVIQFDDVGRKSMMSNHPKLTRIAKKGGQA